MWICIASNALRIKPLIMEIIGIIGIIIGVTRCKPPSPDQKNKSQKENRKVLDYQTLGFSYPEWWMVLSTLMISTYNIMMCLTQTGWWWSIKHKPPDPFSPTTGTKRWAYQKIKKRK